MRVYGSSIYPSSENVVLLHVCNVGELVWGLWWRKSKNAGLECWFKNIMLLILAC